jgi:hypothetical protein
MPGDRAALWLVPDGEDQMPRLERFRDAHPEVVILLRGAMPKAWVKGGEDRMRYAARPARRPGQGVLVVPRRQLARRRGEHSGKPIAPCMP